MDLIDGVGVIAHAGLPAVASSRETFEVGAVELAKDGAGVDELGPLEVDVASETAGVGVEHAHDVVVVGVEDLGGGFVWGRGFGVVDCCDVGC